VVPLRISTWSRSHRWLLKTFSNLMLRMGRCVRLPRAEMLPLGGRAAAGAPDVTLEPGARGLIDRVFDYTHRAWPAT